MVKASAEAFGLFPVPCYKVVLEQCNLEEIKEVVGTNWHEGDEHNFMSHDKFILQDERLSHLKEEIKMHLDEMMFKYWKTNVRMSLTQSWVNKNPKGTSHVEHTHRNSIWNGVIFLNDHPTPMKFRDPNPWKDLWDMASDVTESNWSNGNIANIYPTENTLIMFPHYLHHSVPVNNYEVDRYSLAFNTWFGEPFGDVERLTYIGAEYVQKETREN